jgi:anti-anti-sigma factor
MLVTPIPDEKPGRTDFAMTNQDPSAFASLDTAVWQTGQESAIVVLTGELDIATAPQLRQRLADLSEWNIIHLVIDFANLEFIDSSGLSLVVTTLEHMKSKGGSLTVRNASPMAMRTFELTGLMKYVSVTRCAEQVTEWPHGMAGTIVGSAS